MLLGRATIADQFDAAFFHTDFWFMPVPDGNSSTGF